jgi:SP family sugar:H+ symporter-like MFS transporter
MYRTLLGISMQALQQLTGANFFFYYGTTIFQATGLNDSFQTSLILGGINFAMTIPGTYVVEKFGRRRALITGGLWMFACFMVFASVGHFALDQDVPQNTPEAGSAMIAFAALFIAGYAMTWAPIVWAIVGELYPSRYRAQAMGLATASNWIWVCYNQYLQTVGNLLTLSQNFLISFFTPFITGAIDYRYGYVFAACNLLGSVVVYFFLCETRGRSLEEIDTMYIMHVPPRKSTNWVPPQGEDLVTADALHLAPGARKIRKADAAGMEGEQRIDALPPATAQHGIHDVTGTGYEAEAGGVRGQSVY